MTLISVVMPIYNMERYIDTSIQSILSQTYDNFEFIIIDDGSQDESASIVKSYNDDRIKFYQQENLGVSAARNIGIAKAVGKYIAFVDADDICFPSKFKVQVSMMESSGIPCTGTLMYYMNEEGKYFGICGEQVEFRINDLADGRLMPFALSSVMIERDLLIKVGLFNELFNSAEDHELLSRVANKAQVSTIMQRLGAYRIHSQSATNLGYVKQGILSKYVEELRKSEKVFGAVIPFSDFLAENMRNVKFLDLLGAKFYFRQAGYNFISKRYFFAVIFAARSFMLSPKFFITQFFFRIIPLITSIFKRSKA